MRWIRTAVDGVDDVNVVACRADRFNKASIVAYLFCSVH